MERIEALTALNAIKSSKCTSDEDKSLCESYIRNVIRSQEVDIQVQDWLGKFTDHLTGAGKYRADYLSRMSDKKFVTTLTSYVETRDIPDSALAKALSSYVTHATIEVEQGAESSQFISSELRVVSVLNLVTHYWTNNQFPTYTHEFIKELLK
ncbi:hypothetical protein HSE3_gp058 [Bacillus phage vB_BceM-HSE3]|nr:hypothetical protein HSE3_gp058 [Bacillus phage vB_BceM-HSE3]